MVGIKNILQKKDFIIILISSIIFYLGMEVFSLLPNISGELTNIYGTLVFFIFLFGFPYLISKHLLKKGIKTAILLFILIYGFGIGGIVAIFGSNIELTKIIISILVLVFSRITIFSIIYLTLSYIFNFFNTNIDREIAREEKNKPILDFGDFPSPRIVHLPPEKSPVSHSTYIRSREWNVRRKQALKDANYKCERCGISGKKLEVHHLHYENLGEELPEDLIAVCRKCHLELELEKEEQKN